MDALACGALSNLPGALTVDLTMSPPTSIAVAPSVPCRNSGSSSSRSSSSSSCVGCLDGVPYSLVWVCLAQVTLLPTALTELARTNCLGVSWQCGTNVLATRWRHACFQVFDVRLTFQGTHPHAQTRNELDRACRCTRTARCGWFCGAPCG